MRFKQQKYSFITNKIISLLLSPNSVPVCFQKYPLNLIFFHFKDRIPCDLQICVNNKISYGRCSSTYIGEYTLQTTSESPSEMVKPLQLLPTAVLVTMLLNQVMI